MIDLLSTARSSMTRHRMLRPGDRVLVAVSGGPDSLALFSALTVLRRELKLTLRAAYVDHRLRPVAAKREAALVKRLGKEWGVPVTVLLRPVRKGKKNSLETSARETRYEALAALAGKLRAQAIATGHTANDQAETVLMRILRGTGPTGLTGIPPVRMAGKLRIIRPLIGCTREQVMEHLRARGLHPLLDRSNLSRRYTRNRIRHDLLFQLERQYNPQIRRHLVELAETVRDDLDCLEQEAARLWRQAARVKKGSVRFQRELLQKAHPALQRALYRKAVRTLRGDCQGFTRRHWQLLEELAANGNQGALDLPHRLRAEVRTNK